MIALYLACLENADDRRRFEEIWHACKRLVFHTAYTILWDEHLAEDVMQEAFFYLARHFSAIDTADDRRVRRYLVLVARSRALDQLRRTGSETPDPEPDTGADPAPVPEDAVVAGEQLARLLELVSQLPERDRILLELAVQGASGAQMAAALGVNEATARKRLRRARARLWKELNRDA